MVSFKQSVQRIVSVQILTLSLSDTQTCSFSAIAWYVVIDIDLESTGSRLRTTRSKRSGLHVLRRFQLGRLAGMGDVDSSRSSLKGLPMDDMLKIHSAQLTLTVNSQPTKDCEELTSHSLRASVHQCLLSTT